MLRTVTPADADPVSLDEAKRHLRIDFPDDDEIIKGLISAATVHAQNLVQRRFVTQTVEWALDCWHTVICLPVAPVAKDGVLSIKYVDWATQAEQTLDPSLYVVRPRSYSVAIRPKFGTVWPILFPDAPEPVVIQFRAGEAVDKIAPNVKAAIKLILGHLYENRESVTVDTSRGVAIELPQGVEALLFAERW